MSHESNKGENSTIEEITLERWEEFEEAIEKDYNTITQLKNSNLVDVSNLLFRGQANKSWRLETTLERYVREKNVTKRDFSWFDYWRILKSIKPTIYSLAEYKPEFENFDIGPLSTDPPCYEFMIYIRHHGFPSPLLDWTRSPYVAAYFAFNDSKKDEDVAIYSYLENGGKMKTTSPTVPQIKGLGPYAETHKRHYQQQCEYTICFTEAYPFMPPKPNDDKIYACHEGVQFGDLQDFLKKYIIPSTEKKKVLRKLDLMNINAFSLFGNEESLMDTLAYREIENKR